MRVAAIRGRREPRRRAGPPTDARHRGSGVRLVETASEVIEGLPQAIEELPQAIEELPQAIESLPRETRP